MDERKHCVECGAINVPLKRGWTNALYCSEECERSSVSRLHASMPRAGEVPRYNWVPYHISVEISRRWEATDGHD